MLALLAEDHNSRPSSRFCFSPAQDKYRLSQPSDLAGYPICGTL